jgi:prepilin-type N-terminal cleavage/methylation domain-containing protein
MKTNNKGFTLLELIIAFAIMSIVSAIVLGFLATGSNIFRSVYSESKLQYNSQLAMSQLQEYIIDCNGGICFETDASSNTKTLSILNRNSDGTGHLYTVQYSNEQLTMSEQTITKNADGSFSYTAITGATNPPVLTDHVSDFSVALALALTNSHVSTATVNLSFQYGGKDNVSSQTISPRNQVSTGSTASQMIQSVFS